MRIKTHYLRILVCFTLVSCFLYLFGHINLDQKSPIYKVGRLSYQCSKPLPPEQVFLAHDESSKHVEEEEEHCPLLSLKHKSKWTINTQAKESECKSSLPQKETCEVAKILFFQSKPPSCETDSVAQSRSYDFCQVKPVKQGHYSVSCNKTTVQRVCISPLAFAVPNPATGVLKWQESPTTEILEENLSLLANGNTKHFGFCFLSCKTNDGENVSQLEEKDEDIDEDYGEVKSSAEQLIILPPLEATQSQKAKHSPVTTNKNININLILLDSVSHQHFFRSLNTTVNFLENLNKNPSSLGTAIDFELFQAVRSRTFETLQTIFSGDIDPTAKVFGTQEIPPKPLNISYLFQMFKKRGYSTLLLEDLCYLWEWGISKDLHFLNKSITPEETWTNMWERLQEHHIDDVAVTLSACDILAANGVNDPFHGVDTLCFSGKNGHEYFLEYLLSYQKTLELQKKPSFTFSMFNTGHEDTGRRIQTMDQHLAQYLQSVVNSLPNTLTILFSDHGNTYGEFVSKLPSDSSNIEIYHPFLLFIVPNQVAQRLGDAYMKSLGVNARRLVSALDLHYTLTHLGSPEKKVQEKHLQYNVSYKGLFEEVSPDRTCLDIPRIRPNLCICKGFDADFDGSKGHELLGYLAVALLNDEIQRQYKVAMTTSSSFSAFGRCERLWLQQVKSMKRSMGEDGNVNVEISLTVQQSQQFLVALTIVNSRKDTSCLNSSIFIKYFDRITKYSHFSTCADPIDLPLCVCDTGKTSSSENSEQPVQTYVPDLEHYKTLKVLDSYALGIKSVVSYKNCLILLTIRHLKGAFLSVANLCSDLSFSVDLDLVMNTDIVYYRARSELVVGPGGQAPLALIFTGSLNIQWKGSANVFSHILADGSWLKN